jgi:hypothetical protein
MSWWGRGQNVHAFKILGFCVNVESFSLHIFSNLFYNVPVVELNLYA